MVTDSREPTSSYPAVNSRIMQEGKIMRILLPTENSFLRSVNLEMESRDTVRSPRSGIKTVSRVGMIQSPRSRQGLSRLLFKSLNKRSKNLPNYSEGKHHDGSRAPDRKYHEFTQSHRVGIRKSFGQNVASTPSKQKQERRPPFLELEGISRTQKGRMNESTFDIDRERIPSPFDISKDFPIGVETFSFESPEGDDEVRDAPESGKTESPRSPAPSNTMQQDIHQELKQSYSEAEVALDAKCPKKPAQRYPRSSSKKARKSKKVLSLFSRLLSKRTSFSSSEMSTVGETFTTTLAASSLDRSNVTSSESNNRTENINSAISFREEFSKENEHANCHDDDSEYESLHDAPDWLSLLEDSPVDTPLNMNQPVLTSTNGEVLILSKTGTFDHTFPRDFRPEIFTSDTCSEVETVLNEEVDSKVSFEDEPTDLGDTPGLSVSDAVGTGTTHGYTRTGIDLAHLSGFRKKVQILVSRKENDDEALNLQKKVSDEESSQICAEKGSEKETSAEKEEGKIEKEIPIATDADILRLEEHICSLVSSESDDMVAIVHVDVPHKNDSNPARATDSSESSAEHSRRQREDGHKGHLRLDESLGLDDELLEQLSIYATSGLLSKDSEDMTEKRQKEQQSNVLDIVAEATMQTCDPLIDRILCGSLGAKHFAEDLSVSDTRTPSLEYNPTSFSGLYTV